MSDHKPDRIWVDFEPKDWPSERIMYGDMDSPYVAYVRTHFIEALEAERDALAEKLERLRNRVEAADALVHAGNTLALRLSCIVGREMIVDRWEVATAQYERRATEDEA